MLAIGIAALAASMLVAVLIGPFDLPPRAIALALVGRLPFVTIHDGLGPLASAALFQIRLPRVVLGAMVGGTLAVSGAAYQGVFQNALADPYLLGVASGAGLGATAAIVLVQHPAALALNPVPLAAFAGAVVSVAATYVLGRSAGRARSSATLVLAGVAVAAFFTAVQTFLLQRNTAELQQVYSWILGSLANSSWQQVGEIAPYVAIGVAVILFASRLLDVMSVGDEEADSLGVRAERVRLAMVIAATLATAAVVAVSGLIGFVGIVVPHAVRLCVGTSYRRIVPLSLLFGGSFLIVADVLARTVAAPGEIPIGVVTAMLGAPFFLVVLRQARRAP
ncbi:MAG: iron ABC transporter permease [Actinomycetota bacterium]|nr:iron ABC transporter permease [Actinomycetota bacterium]